MTPRPRDFRNNPGCAYYKGNSGEVALITPAKARPFFTNKGDEEKRRVNEDNMGG
jgi:hypothetical protein